MDMTVSSNDRPMPNEPERCTASDPNAIVASN